MSSSDHVFDRYLKQEKLPHIWCPGCGNGIVVNALIRAIDNVGLDSRDLVINSGIGCSGRASGYVNFCAFHPTHGRALAYATGVKLYKPKLKVITIMGDGDCASIGGNHLIHAARRNIDITAIVINNNNYGMTGGQYSATTSVGAKTKTSPYGHIEPNFDICDLVKSAGATYAARTTTYHVNMIISYLQRALIHKGFSLVEVISGCPTLYGRFNKLGSASQMLLDQKANSIPIDKAMYMTHDELSGKIVTGELVNTLRPEYTEQYDKLIMKAQGEE